MEINIEVSQKERKKSLELFYDFAIQLLSVFQRRETIMTRKLLSRNYCATIHSGQ